MASERTCATAPPMGEHLDTQNGICIRCLYCNDPACCARPTVCPGYLDPELRREQESDAS